MKKKVLILSVLISIFILTVTATKLIAGQSDYYKMNKALCAQYISLSQKAFDENDLYNAKLYAQKAVQSDPWSKNAWNTYNRILIKISGGNSGIMLEPKKEKIELPTDAPSAEDEGAIEGC